MLGVPRHPQILTDQLTISSGVLPIIPTTLLLPHGFLDPPTALADPQCKRNFCEFCVRGSSCLDLFNCIFQSRRNLADVGKFVSEVEPARAISFGTSAQCKDTLYSAQLCRLIIDLLIVNRKSSNEKLIFVKTPSKNIRAILERNRGHVLRTRISPSSFFLTSRK